MDEPMILTDGSEWTWAVLPPWLQVPYKVVGCPAARAHFWEFNESGPNWVCLHCRQFRGVMFRPRAQWWHKGKLCGS